MPSLDDISILPKHGFASDSIPAGDDLISIVDVSAADARRSNVKRVPLYSIQGIAPGDVETVTGTTHTISKTMNVYTSTSAIAATLPAASGTIRRVVVMKASATSAVTVGRAGSDVIVSGSSVSATSVAVNAGLSAVFLSDGTTWYHVTNDA